MLSATPLSFPLTHACAHAHTHTQTHPFVIQNDHAQQIPEGSVIFPYIIS